MAGISEAPQTILRPMTLADLDQVEEIDQVSFPMPWPKKAFHYELTRNPNALCWVAEQVEPGRKTLIIASIVIWLVLDEAHIATLAVRPEYRGKGVAQQLLTKTLLESAQSGAKHALLEVRAGNQAAQSLYRKFGFDVVGVRKNYYQDTHEDALLMTLVPLDPDKISELVEP